MERFFVLVNRLNSLLLLLVLLGAAAAIVWMSAESSHWRRRGTVEVAASEPATGDSVLMAFERAEVITGSQTLMLRLTSSRKSAGFSSGGGGSETRNVLFLAGADRAPRWLFADHRHVVLTLAQLRDDAAPDWPRPPSGRPGVHRCIVTGNPSVQLECFVTGEDGDHNTGGVQTTAMRVINAIPAVQAHAPGIVSMLDLPYTPSKNLRIGV